MKQTLQRTILAAALFMSSATVGLAQSNKPPGIYLRAGAMISGCRVAVSNRPEGYEAGLCAGLAMSYLGGTHEGQCIPQGTSMTTMMKAFIEFTDKRMELWDDPFVGVFYYAMATTWPCKK